VSHLCRRRAPCPRRRVPDLAKIERPTSGLGGAVACGPGAAQAVDLRPERAHFALAGPTDVGADAAVEGDVRGPRCVGAGVISQPSFRRLGEAGAPRFLLAARSRGPRRPARPKPCQGCPPAAGELRPHGLPHPKAGGPARPGMRAIRHPCSRSRLHRDPVGRGGGSARRTSRPRTASALHRRGYRGGRWQGQLRTHKRVVPFPAAGCCATPTSAAASSNMQRRIWVWVPFGFTTSGTPPRAWSWPPEPTSRSSSGCSATPRRP
jgi:hypothetical protein